MMSALNFFELTKDTPYLTLLGELWGAFQKYLEKSCYNIISLYFHII